MQAVLNVTWSLLFKQGRHAEGVAVLDLNRYLLRNRTDSVKHPYEREKLAECYALRISVAGSVHWGEACSAKTIKNRWLLNRTNGI